MPKSAFFGQGFSPSKAQDHQTAANQPSAGADAYGGVADSHGVLGAWVNGSTPGARSSLVANVHTSNSQHASITGLATSALRSSQSLSGNWRFPSSRKYLWDRTAFGAPLCFAPQASQIASPSSNPRSTTFASQA